MPDLPAANGLQTIKAFEKFGFVVDRVKGSHHVMKKPDHTYVLTKPVHGAKNLKPGVAGASFSYTYDANKYVHGQAMRSRQAGVFLCFLCYLLFVFRTGGRRSHYCP
ncbi:MAG: type II toxin-antitoxin system HicA family toxin [Patescibacteria group bacterium]|nr:type II toxin-antitoxin system HicA family toxin [Patescibacteria group bacterium]